MRDRIQPSAITFLGRVVLPVALFASSCRTVPPKVETPQKPQQSSPATERYKKKVEDRLGPICIAWSRSTKILFTSGQCILPSRYPSLVASHIILGSLQTLAVGWTNWLYEWRVNNYGPRLFRQKLLLNCRAVTSGLRSPSPSTPKPTQHRLRLQRRNKPVGEAD